jgi:hypothetical protein
MSDPIQIDEARRRRDQALAEVAGLGGGGHDGGMSELERRVGSLETKVDRILVDLAEVRVDLAELRGKVSQLPTVWMLLFANFGLAVTVSALVFAIARAMK